MIGSGGYGNIHAGPPGTVYKTAQGDTWNLGDCAIIQEAAALQVLRGSPGVMELIDFRICGARRPYLVLPLIEDTTLDELKIPYPRSLGVFLAAAAIICDGHRKGIIHRDIKPGNIFITPDGPLVFDYGLCYIQGQPDLPVEEDYFLGTPCIMPPEVILNKDLVVGPKQDYYQLGVLLHWLVECDYPTPGYDPEGAMRNAVAGVRAPVRPEVQEARDLLMGPRDLDAGVGLISELLLSEVGA